MSNVPVAIINDCSRDANGRGRQELRVISLFGSMPVSFPVNNDAEAAFNLIDAIDASLVPGVFLVNIAPRNGEAKNFENGSPFCFFWHEDSLVVATDRGHALDLVCKLGITQSVIELDIHRTASILADGDKDLEDRIVKTQFRSFEFVPRIAHLLFSRKYADTAFWGQPRFIQRTFASAICVVDKFGNCKTCCLPEEIGFEDGAEIEVLPGITAICYAGGLKAVPDDGTLALVIGSSGYKDKRFVEIVINGGSAAEYLTIASSGLVIRSGLNVFPDFISAQAAV